ncbi:hypothetical protein QBC34DRAFT_410546 [Podospora aff. communis PSN243]|uniref:Uncharacterized protein n=1 Tax=Podospora aff. communis PSN243 TaxID=3040156 RepID=A0AAV9GDJ5_9PEZI|nr:hypothetical protein QBC34DRAFT_410546 [Podospora aff. communis PSN243]
MDRLRSKRGKQGDLGAIFDTADVPKNGFLEYKDELPTYQTYRAWHYYIQRSSEPCMPLMIDDVTRAILQQSHLSRRILFETERLRRWPLSIRSITLSGNNRKLDMALAELVRSLRESLELLPTSAITREQWEEMTPEEQASSTYLLQELEEEEFILESEKFKTTLSTVKKSLLAVEKQLHDKVVGELKQAMISKGDIDYDLLTQQVQHSKGELHLLYRKVREVYLECRDDFKATAQIRQGAREGWRRN